MLVFSQKGETLIEALGALAIISVVIAAVASSVISGLSNAKHNENETFATKYAQQAIEQLRQIRNADYASFQTYEGNYCFAKDQMTLGSPQSNCTTPNIDNTFIRSIAINQSPGCAANVARINVTVAYTDGKCQSGVYCHKQEHISCLSTINPISAP